MRGLLIIMAFIFCVPFVGAQEFVKTFDGSIAYCQSQDDVARHAMTGVTVLKAEKIEDLGNDYSLNVRVYFYRCEKKENSFEFVQVKDPSHFVYQFGNNTLTVETIDFTLRVFTADYDLLDSGPLYIDARANTGKLIFSKTSISRLRDGRGFVDVDVTARARVTDQNGNESEFRPITYGSFRLFLN